VQENSVAAEDPVAAAKTAFETILTGNPSSSALDASGKGLLRSSDEIVMNREHVLGASIERVASMANAGYQVPDRVKLALSSSSGKRALMEWVSERREVFHLTATDIAVADILSSVLTGEDTAGGPVSEENMMALERKAVLTLAKMPATRERIEHMLATGKPLRN
jgi:3-hydroxyacyl-CoA dehydrogenase